MSNSAGNGGTHVSYWPWRRLGSNALVSYYSVGFNKGNNAASVDPAKPLLE